MNRAMQNTKAPDKPEKLSKILSGIAGEYFVAAELSRRGFIAAVTLRNTRGADILVSRTDSEKSATIQVKTIQTGNVEWVLSQSDEIPKKGNHYYVFVALNGCEAPEYHVVPGEEVAQWCADFHVKYMSERKKDGSKKKDTTMRVFRPGEKYRNRWDLISV